jgi:protein-arginine kinase activator protein McsA
MNIVETYHELNKKREYVCPKCLKSSTPEEWTISTQKDYGYKIINLKECIDNIKKQKSDDDYGEYEHTCPKCKHCYSTNKIIEVSVR